MAKTRTQFVENGKTYFRTADIYNTDIWELVNSFPLGYCVWNIGVENSPALGYLPLARLTCEPNRISRKNLKTIYVGEVLHRRFMDYTMRSGEFIDALNFDDVYKTLLSDYSTLILYVKDKLRYKQDEVNVALKHLENRYPFSQTDISNDVDNAIESWCIDNDKDVSEFDIYTTFGKDIEDLFFDALK